MTANRPDTPLWMRICVWLSRLLTGSTFILSGWAKSVDPWGFVYKLEDYLAVWDIGGVPRELVVVAAVGLSIFEFATGVMLLTGSLRRAAPVSAAALMAVMLPLTLYIYIADPVPDCGCFGDLWVISNGATFAKNLVLTAMVVFLLLYNTRCKPAILPGLQWLLIVLSCIYPLTLAFIGWQLQPVADFRPYGIGKSLTPSAETAESEDDITYVYTKDGREQEFSLDALPDSTWTYVGPGASAVDAADESRPAIFDGDEEVTDLALEPGENGELVIITIPEPSLDYLARARYANEINEYVTARGGRMVALVAANDKDLERWRQMARPEYEVFSCSDTALKQMVRGTMGLIRTVDGRIVLKRNFSTLDPALLERADPFGSLWVVDNGRLSLWLLIFFLAGVALLYIPGRIYDSLRPSQKKLLKKISNDSDKPAESGPEPGSED